LTPGVAFILPSHNKIRDTRSLFLKEGGSLSGVVEEGGAQNFRRFGTNHRRERTTRILRLFEGRRPPPADQEQYVSSESMISFIGKHAFEPESTQLVSWTTKGDYTSYRAWM
jgi:hypothetical protein